MRIESKELKIWLAKYTSRQAAAAASASDHTTAKCLISQLHIPILTCTHTVLLQCTQKTTSASSQSVRKTLKRPSQIASLYIYYIYTYRFSELLQLHALARRKSQRRSLHLVKFHAIVARTYSAAYKSLEK